MKTSTIMLIFTIISGIVTCLSFWFSFDFEPLYSLIVVFTIATTFFILGYYDALKQERSDDLERYCEHLAHEEHIIERLEQEYADQYYNIDDGEHEIPW